jgi:hypothetical protein
MELHFDTTRFKKEPQKAQEAHVPIALLVVPFFFTPVFPSRLS